MNKYIKPTITLLNAGTTTAAASSCSTSTTEAKEIEAMLKDMGYTSENAFSATEPCSEPVVIEDYCKFTSSIQVFFS